jgi:hypothetical protein
MLESTEATNAVLPPAKSQTGEFTVGSLIKDHKED